jgi:hypothetical protein
MSAYLCDFTITLHLCADGLLGGTAEYNPYFAVHGSFDGYKVKREVPLQLVGTQPRELIAQSPVPGEETYYYDNQLRTYRAKQPLSFRFTHQGAETRVDEAINAELWCHTRLSGIKELDKREGEYAERQVSMGLFQLGVAQIIALYKSSNTPLGQPFTVDASIVDDKIIGARIMDYAQEERKQLNNELYMQYARRAFSETRKGQVKFEICMNQFSDSLYTGSVFHIDNFQSRTCLATNNNASVTSTISSHNNALQKQTPLSRGRVQPRGHHSEPQPMGPPNLIVVDNGASDTALQQNCFQPWSHTSSLGQQKMNECMMRCVLSTYCRTFMKLDSQDPDPLYGPTDDVVKNLQFPQWIGKMGKGPVISYFACHDVSTRTYPSEAARLEDYKRYGLNAKTERHLLMIVNSALRGRGLSAREFEHTLRHHFSPDNKSTTLSPLFMLCEEVVSRLGTFAANTGYYTADYRMVRKMAMGNLAKMIVLDSWDNTLLNNSGRSDDCEGQDNTATTIIRAFGTGRHELGFKWESSLLNAIQLYLRHSVIYDIGGTVTSAFFNNSKETVDLHKADLPMNDDEMDLRSKSDGHCFGLMESLSNCIKRLEQGNLGAKRLAQIKASTLQCEAFQRRDALRRPLLLEGTGTVEPRCVLPLKEAYAGNESLLKSKLAERLFSRALHAGLKKSKEESGGTDLGGIINGEGLSHYVEVQDPRRRTSDFYKQLVMGCSVELYQRFGITGSQFAFTRRGDDGQLRYGVRVAEFLRTTDRFALVFPFANCSEEWQQHVTQLTECVQHQLPLMAFGRYSDEQYAQTHSKYLHGSMANQQAFEEVVRRVASDPKLTIARLQARDWRLNAEPEKTRALFQKLVAMPGVRGYACYSENHLPICDPIDEILVIGEVDTWLQFKEAQ